MTNMTPETKAKIDKELKDRFVNGNVFLQEQYNIGKHFAAYGYNLAVEEMSKCGEFREYWLEELNEIETLVHSDFSSVRYKAPEQIKHVIDIAALQAANARITTLEDKLSCQIKNVQELDEENRKYRYQFGHAVKIEAKLQNHELQTKLTTLEARVEKAEKVIKCVQDSIQYHADDQFTVVNTLGIEAVNSYLQNKGG